jgi:hypothetical protein
VFIFLQFGQNKKGLPPRDKPLNYLFYLLRHSPATHIVLKMMVVVDAYVDVLSHLRLLRNRIVAGYQNFRWINIGEKR